MAIDINIPSQVRTFANLAAFPASGALKTIYIAEDTNKTYRWTGSVYVEVSAAGATGITIGTTAITSGTVGRVLFEGTGNVVQESANLFWDNTNGRLGVGGTPSAFTLDVNGTARVQTSLEIAGATGVTLGGGASALAYSGNVLNIGNSASWTDIRLYAGGVQKFSQTSSLTTISNTTINLSTATVQLAGVNALTYSGTDIRIGSVAAGFNSLSMYVAGSERARIASTGNVLINTTTDAGFKLDVNGTARVSGNLTLTGGSLLMNNNNIYIARGTGGASDGMEIRALSSGTDAVKVTTSSVSISSVGGITYQASAQLAVDSTTRGFLPPRMTTTQKNAIATPAAGLMVYDTTLTRPCFYDGTTWITL